MPQIIYTVERGDTLSSIARFYGTTVNAIVRANNIQNPQLIYPGTILDIPVEETEPGSIPPGSLIYVVQPNDTLYTIALLFGVSVQSILEINHITNPSIIYPGTQLVLPENAVNPFKPTPSGIIEYTVNPGDTLYLTAIRFSTTINAIIELNPGINPTNLRVGQIIRIRIPPNAVAIYRGNPSKKMIALTFDATYGDNQTLRLLEILRNNRIKATFFFSGIWPLNFPALARSIASEGHEIGNHSYSHPHMPQLSQPEISNQIIRTEAIIRSITGKDTYLFRPPFGEYNQSMLNVLAQLGYLTIMWTIDSLDWKNPGVDSIVNRVISNIQNGAIILMHQSAVQTPQALPIIISRLRNLGYSFGTVTQVLDP